MVKFLMDPEQYRTWRRTMPNLAITEAEARATVAYLKWLSGVDTNGFPQTLPAFKRTDRSPRCTALSTSRSSTSLQQ